MENYKIFENRPELSKEQLTQGMDFAKIKAGAAIAKTAIVKTLIIKGLFMVAVMTAGIVFYLKTDHMPSQKNTFVLADTLKEFIVTDTQHIMNETTITHTTSPIKKESSHNTITTTVTKMNPVLDTPKTAAQPITITQPKIQALTACSITIKEMPVIDTIIESNKQSSLISYKTTSKNINVKSCIIWHTNDYCSIARTKEFKFTIECDACDFDDVTCASVNQNSNMVCVLLTLYCDRKQNFNIETGFKNITLLNAANNKSKAFMAGIGNDKKFIGPDFKAKKFLVQFDKEIQLLLFFKNAKVGDTIIINNFIEAQIEK